MKSIGIIPNEFKDKNLACTSTVLDYLSDKDCIVHISEKYEPILMSKTRSNIFFVEEDDIFLRSDILITIGGDGTILEASHKVAEKNTPILGINLGTVGFMTEIETSETELLDALFTSDYSVESRMMLDVELIRNGTSVGVYHALNDVVLFKGVISKLIEINFFCNDTLATTYRADGIIVATPTGSTAYSLSAGGAVIDPVIEALCVTPISSNAFLNSFPMVYSAENKLVLEIARERDDSVYLSYDGIENIKILFGDKIVIKRSDLTTKLIRIKNTGFYEAVYKKLPERGKA